MVKLRFVPHFIAFGGFAIFIWKFNFVVDRDGSGYSNTSTLQLLVMKQRLLPSTLLVLVSVALLSCHKEPSDSGGGAQKSKLEMRADSLNHFVRNQHFIPIDFYASKPIDYNQEDSAINLSRDLKPFIMQYLTDDIIVLMDNDTLRVDQGRLTYTRPAGELQLPTKFDSVWKIETSKAKNEVYLQYLTYTYYQQRYVVDSFSNTTMVAHIPWVSKIDSNDKALLYTRFVKR